MEVMRPTVFRIGIEDRPGALNDLLSKTAGAGANVMFMTALSTGGGKGTAYVIADEPEAVRGLAKSESLAVEEYTGLLVRGPDRAGAGAEVTRPLADQGINIVLSSAMVAGGEYRLLIVVDPTYVDAAAKALGA